MVPIEMLVSKCVDSIRSYMVSSQNAIFRTRFWMRCEVDFNPFLSSGRRQCAFVPVCRRACPVRRCGCAQLRPAMPGMKRICKSAENITCQSCLIVFGWSVFVSLMKNASKHEKQQCCLIVAWAVLLSNQLFCLVFGRGECRRNLSRCEFGGSGERFRERNIYPKEEREYKVPRRLRPHVPGRICSIFLGIIVCRWFQTSPPWGGRGAS